MSFNEVLEILKNIGIIFFIIINVLFVFAIIKRKRKSSTEGKIKLTDLKENLYKNKSIIRNEALWQKQDYKRAKPDFEDGVEENFEWQNVYVIDYEGDLMADETDILAQKISAVLQVADEDDEVVIRLKSPGGVVHGYGLAASQLNRIRQAGIPLTVCIDLIGASGGYMMASVANKIVAAPFAYIGSIGVISAMPNIHRFLKDRGIDYHQFTSGRYKRTVTLMGNVTNDDLEKEQEDVERVHELFKNHVLNFRPQLKDQDIFNGDIWFGQEAKDLGLVDEVDTSDDYLISKMTDHDVFLLEIKKPTPWKERLLGETVNTLAKYAFAAFNKRYL